MDKEGICTGEHVCQTEGDGEAPHPERETEETAPAS